MHPPGQTPHDPYRPHGSPPPGEPWRSPWSAESDPLPVLHPTAPVQRPFEEDEAEVITSPVIQELKASFARQRRRQMNYLVLFAVAVFSFTLMAWVYVRDADPPWDGDLMPVKIEPSTLPCPAPDRLRQALDAATAVDDATVSRLNPSQWDTPALSRIVGAHVEAFSHLKELLGDEDWQPSHSAWKTVDLGSHEHWVDLGIAKEAAAAYYSRRGQDEAAMYAGMELALLAQKLQSINAWPAYYARGVEMHERACKAIAAMLRQTSMDARTLSRVQAEFEGLAPTDVIVKARLSGFYEFERHLIAGPSPGNSWEGPPVDHGNKLFFKPNHTLGLFASSLRELSDQVGKGPTAVTNQLKVRIGPQGIPAGLPFAPNRTGMRYANERIWSYAGMLDHLALQRTRHALVLTLFGVRRYALDHGKAPGKLEDLLPNYFVALPADPYTSEPFRYDAAKGLIYSVGTNFKAEGGRDNDNPLSDSTEPTVMVRSSEP